MRVERSKVNRSVVLVMLIVATVGWAQAQSTVSVIDFVRIKNGKQREALFFYENNWKVYREIAIEKGYIKAYQLLTTQPDTTRNFDLMLITEYADSLQLALSEDRFQKIIKTTSPNGPKLLNDLKPGDFRINVFLKRGRKVFSSDAGL
jgi:hypothetical protein